MVTYCEEDKIILSIVYELWTEEAYGSMLDLVETSVTILPG